MEGPRLPPSATFHESDDDKPDDPPPTWHRPTSSLSALPSQDPPSHHWRNHSLNLSPILDTPSRFLPPQDSIPELETYVVQVPRDQIYWTPPPEHAKYVEKLRNNPERNKKNGCSKRLMWFFIILIAFGSILGAITLILHLVFNPALPIFAVERLNVKTSSFEVTLRAENPTSNMGVSYVMKPNGVVSLTYKNKRLGRGKFPKMFQAASGSDKVNVKLDGSTKNAVMPPRGSKQAVSLVLKMELKADYEAGPVKKNKEVVVTCDVKVKGLLDAKKVEIVSENCEILLNLCILPPTTFEPLLLPPATFGWRDPLSLGVFKVDYIFLLHRSSLTGEIHLWVKKQQWSMMMAAVIPEAIVSW
ncbi:unnamed protein product [Brassica rapa subsp. narinosa]|uniref:Late embryogenesis abundant protein LEA-2 subgroup domain-containing protein n=1 Tax=Brassica campestris TaxID=3711 RepID=M4FBS4_BRACM